jgi:SAM-dependent methyltransferase
MTIASGFMASKLLFVAGAIDLFAALKDGPRSAEELAQRTGVPRRTVRIVADAMAALGLVTRREERYENSPTAAAFLAGGTAADLRPFLRFWDRISYPKWMGLETAVRTATGVEQGRRATPEEARIFSEGVAAISGGAARALAGSYDWSRHRRILDLGGGTGNFLRALLAQNPDLRGTLMELPESAAVARRQLEGNAAAGRIDILEGNFLEDPIPGDHDAFLVANVVHLLSPEHNGVLFRRVREAAKPGDRMLLVDFWMDPTRTQPKFAALMSGEFLVLTGEGESYAEEDVRGWLSASGWRPLERRPLAGPSSVVIAEAA